ncbi:hypothetical protein F4604DRAFT_1812073 [Suillus subluteus]|nr:hypothetical protein F4604DRAFT_1812073 [Suillus subluteus]
MIEDHRVELRYRCTSCTSVEYSSNTVAIHESAVQSINLYTSSVGHLPISQPSPVKALASIIHQYHEDQTPQSTLLTPHWNTLVGQALDDLASSSASFLVSDTPITSRDHLPAFTPTPFTPTRKRKHAVLDHQPETEHEHECHNALREAYEREDYYKGALYGMQSTAVLQEMYCKTLSSQLAAQEEKKLARKREKLVGDGLPRLLTGDEFYRSVVVHNNAADAEVAARESRRQERDERASLMKAWKEEDAKRLERNEVRRQEYKEELRQWEEERAKAKLERRRMTHVKPKLGRLEAPLPKPALAHIDEEEDESDDSEEED